MNTCINIMICDELKKEHKQQNNSSAIQNSTAIINMFLSHDIQYSTQTQICTQSQFCLERTVKVPSNFSLSVNAKKRIPLNF